MSLDTERKTYASHLGQWSEHQGKYVLISGDEVVDFFDTYQDAISQGYKQFGLNTFFVKQINIIERVQYITRLAQPTCV